MVKLLDGKDIRTAAKNLEDFRLKMNELEILHGATLTVKYDNWNSDFNLVATRPETDNEMNDRLEKARLAAEAKQRREAEKKAAEAKREADRVIAEQRKAFDMIHELARKHGIHPRDLVDRWTA
jgi:flagellar biosynthesis GTPase FlhF